jgi:hypothetical protein
LQKFGASQLFGSVYNVYNKLWTVEKDSEGKGKGKALDSDFSGGTYEMEQLVFKSTGLNALPVIHVTALKVTP